MFNKKNSERETERYDNFVREKKNVLNNSNKYDGRKESLAKKKIISQIYFNQIIAIILPLFPQNSSWLRYCIWQVCEWVYMCEWIGDVKRNKFLIHSIKSRAQWNPGKKTRKQSVDEKIGNHPKWINDNNVNKSVIDKTIKSCDFTNWNYL